MGFLSDDIRRPGSQYFHNKDVQQDLRSISFSIWLACKWLPLQFLRESLWLGQYDVCLLNKSSWQLQMHLILYLATLWISVWATYHHSDEKWDSASDVVVTIALFILDFLGSRSSLKLSWPSVWNSELSLMERIPELACTQARNRLEYTYWEWHSSWLHVWSMDYIVFTTANGSAMKSYFSFLYSLCFFPSYNTTLSSGVCRFQWVFQVQRLKSGHLSLFYPVIFPRWHWGCYHVCLILSYDCYDG